MKKILVLNGTISEVPIIKKAQEMGFYVITTGNMPELPGHQFSDEYICADYSDGKAILELVKEHEVEGIVSCANDFGAITAAYVSEAMGWKGHDSYENTVLMHNKDLFRQYFIKMGFPVPVSEIFTDLNAAENYCKTCQYPVIIKPNDLTGGKGVQKVYDYENAVTALNLAFSMSRKKVILVEEYLEGIQQSIVVFLVNRKIAVTSSSNVYCMLNPYLVQAETYPTTDFELVEDQLKEIILTMAEDLKLVDGVFSFQYFVKDGKPIVIDMMRRCFGNETFLLADMRTGFPFEEAYIRASLGMDCSNLKRDKQTYQYCGHYGVMADRNGVLESWMLPEDIKTRIFKTTVNIKRGETIHNYMMEKIAHVYFYYDNIDIMNKEITQYNDRVIIKVR